MWQSRAARAVSRTVRLSNSGRHGPQRAECGAGGRWEACPGGPLAATRGTACGGAGGCGTAVTLLDRARTLISRRFQHSSSDDGPAAPLVSLSEAQHGVVEAQRGLLAALLDRLAVLRADDGDTEAVRRALRHLDELFLVVVAGEFSAGKSTLLNALLGKRVLVDGVTPTTHRLGVLLHRDTEQIPSFAETVRDLDVVRADAEWLKHLTLVDTPGTNAVMRDHEALTSSIVPRADLIVFVSSADRPWTESEKQFMSAIAKWRRNVVVVVNKADILRSEADREEIVRFVGTGARDVVGAELPMFMLSAYNALTCKEEGTALDDTWKEFERYIASTLAGPAQISMKLSSPLGVASAVTSRQLEMVRRRADLLGADVRLLDLVEDDMRAFSEEMERDFDVQVARIDTVLAEVVARADEYLDAQVRLGNLLALARGDGFADEFAAAVVGDTSDRTEALVRDIALWFSKKLENHWNSVVSSLVHRASTHSADMVGSVGANFQGDRTDLLMDLSDTAGGIIASYNVQTETKRVQSSLRDAVLATTAVEAGAAGLGTLVAASSLDWTGLAGAGVVAAAGLVILPARRVALKRNFRGQIDNVREGLRAKVTQRLKHELHENTERLKDAIGPYSRFVRRETGRFAEHTVALTELSTQIREIERSVENIAKDGSN